ncbi:hypothetical protein B7494_g7695 [Chlorociboria aeruginascens]|nr:hypothetical protein B7494_g7695 [Chlorociboria aeruginascens]
MPTSPLVRWPQGRTAGRSIPPVLRPVLRAYILGYASSTAPRLLTLLLTHLSKRRKNIDEKPEECFLPSLLRILRGGLELQRFPTFCAALVGDTATKIIVSTWRQVIRRGTIELILHRLAKWLSTFISAWFSLRLLQSKRSALFMDLETEETANGPVVRPRRFAGRTLDLTLFAVTRAVDVIVGELWSQRRTRRITAGKWTVRDMEPVSTKNIFHDPSISQMHFSALPAAAPAPTPAPNLEKRATCTFTNAASASKSKTSCATIVLSSIAVPSGTTLDLTDLTSGTTVIFEGTTTFGYEEWSGPLVSVSGTDITVTGASGSVIDGGGASWWDGEGSNGGVTKPKFFYAHSLTTSTITGLTFKNAPVQLMSINGASTLAVSDLTFDNSAGASLGHNTDAFDVGSSTGVTISGANIHQFRDRGTCDGGHGLSIGSVGGRDDNTVETVTISSSTIKNSQNGVRIKTVYDATGSVSGVTYKDITLSAITSYGIVIEQDYENGSPTGTPTTGLSPLSPLPQR